MADIVLCSIAYNAPWSVAEQIRLCDKHLADDYQLIVYDNSNNQTDSERIEAVCFSSGTSYRRLELEDHMHHLALNAAAGDMVTRGEPYFGFLDHDIFPVERTALIPLILHAGFLAVGQRHHATGKLYPWPGFFFLSRDWLKDRPLDFGGIRGAHKRDDGDTGSLLWPLFVGEDWSRLFSLAHGYKAVREPTEEGVQAWGVEVIGSWIHATNVSRWLQVRAPEERERLIREMLAAA